MCLLHTVGLIIEAKEKEKQCGSQRASVLVCMQECAHRSWVQASHFLSGAELRGNLQRTTILLLDSSSFNRSIYYENTTY